MEKSRRRPRMKMMMGKRGEERSMVKKIRLIQDTQSPTVYRAITQAGQSNEHNIAVSRTFVTHQEDLPSSTQTDGNDDINSRRMAAITRRNANIQGRRKQNDCLSPKKIQDANQAIATDNPSSHSQFQSDRRHLTLRPAVDERSVILRSLLSSTSHSADKSANADIMEQIKWHSVRSDKNNKDVLIGSPERNQCCSCSTLKGTLLAALSRNKLLEELVTVLQLETMQADERSSANETSVHNLITDMCLLQKENEVLKQRLETQKLMMKSSSPEQPTLKLPTILWHEITLE